MTAFYFIHILYVQGVFLLPPSTAASVAAGQTIAAGQAKPPKWKFLRDVTICII
jgi:hypothetical protein